MRKQLIQTVLLVAMIAAHTSSVHACPQYYAPTAVVDIDSYSQGVREITIDVNTYLSFKGGSSYDNDEAGVSITYYKWYVWNYSGSMPSSPTCSSSGSTYSYCPFNTIGKYYVRLVVTDDGLDSPGTGEEPKQSSSTYKTTLNTCIITVVDPATRPLVENISVQNVTAASADLLGELTFVGTGGTDCTVNAYWGTAEGGEHPAGWQNQETFSSAQGIGAFSDTISSVTGFEPGTLYNFRFQAVNKTSQIEGWANIQDPTCYRFVSPPGEAIILPEGLVAHWTFDEGSGTIAYDSVGSVNGSIRNMESSDWVNGRFGKALNFDGEDEYIQFSDVLDNKLGSSFTIGVWIKLGEGALNRSEVNTVFWKCDDRPSINIGIDGRVGFCQWYSGAGTVRSTQILKEGEWYHLSYVYDGSGIAGYINGNCVGTAPNAGYSPGSNLYIAADLGQRCFKGIIDDVRIYGRALSAGEIQVLCNQSDEYSVSSTLYWVSGRSDYPIVHDVYFGTSANAVLNADHGSAEYKGRLGMPYYAPGKLMPHTRYYWRVDEVVLDPYNNNAERIAWGNTPTALRSFTTGIDAPVNVRAYASNSKVSLMWGMDDQENVAGYNVYRSQPGTDFVKLTDLNVPYTCY